MQRIDDKDWFLQQFVHFANLSNIAIGVTLNVGGFLISGLLIGGKEYFDNIGDEFLGSNPTDKNVIQMKEDLFVKAGDMYSSDKYRSSPNIGYIHLKDAKCFNTAGNPIPHNRGVFWRGRLEEVSGFSLGLLSTKDPYNDEENL